MVVVTGLVTVTVTVTRCDVTDVAGVAVVAVTWQWCGSDDSGDCDVAVVSQWWQW